MKLGRSIKVIFILAILITGGFVFWLYNALHSPVSHSSANTYIVIEQGSTSNGILEVLGEHGIIQAPLATKIYLRFFNRDAKMEAGDYKFHTPISPIEVINQLKHGKKERSHLPSLRVGPV